VSDLLEVVVLPTRSDALLARRRPPSARRQLLAEEYAFELHHTRVREQQRGVISGY